MGYIFDCLYLQFPRDIQASSVELAVIYLSVGLRREVRVRDVCKGSP